MISFQAICSCSRVMDRTVNWNSLRVSSQNAKNHTPFRAGNARIIQPKDRGSPHARAPSHRNRDDITDIAAPTAPSPQREL